MCGCGVENNAYNKQESYNYSRGESNPTVTAGLL
jgi:hypothetical protein